MTSIHGFIDFEAEKSKATYTAPNGVVDYPSAFGDFKAGMKIILARLNLSEDQLRLLRGELI
jgi:hypothetical protein